MKHLNPRRKTAPYVTKICRSCGCTFHLLASAAAEGRGVYCNRTCNANGRRTDIESLKPASFWH